MGQVVVPGGATIEVPPDCVGWYRYSAAPGQPGNTVLVGHTPGVFEPLLQVKVGDVITLNDQFDYIVTTMVVLPVTDARLVQPTGDTRVTLITCVGRLLIVQ